MDQASTGPGARAQETQHSPDHASDREGACVLIWEPDDHGADLICYDFPDWDAAMQAAHELDADTSGDWSIEPLRSWSARASAGAPGH
jgi:hypothetical protein